MRARPVDPTDVEGWVDRGLVVRDAQRLELERRAAGGRGAGVKGGAPPPIARVTIDGDAGALPARTHRDDTVILLGVERVEPEPLPIGRIFELDHRPVLLEPLVDQREESRA